MSSRYTRERKYTGGVIVGDGGSVVHGSPHVGVKVALGFESMGGLKETVS